MEYPKREITNPIHLVGLGQECSWDSERESTSTLTATLNSSDNRIQLSISEAKADGSYTARSAIMLNRTQALILLKQLSALI